MGQTCEFCGEQRSMVYCRSDAACLCLSCDQKVHSANALSKRHARTLVCRRCNSQPALVRCVEEKLALCQNCDWMVHGNSTSASTHKRQAIDSYTGCPSAAELSSTWSFILDIDPAIGSTCEQQLGLMSIADNSSSTATNSYDASSLVKIDNVVNAPKPFVSGTSSLPELSYTCNLSCPETRAPTLCEHSSFYEDFNIDEVDLNLESYEELFDIAFNSSEDLFENGGIDSLFRTKDVPAAGSHCHASIAAEGSSIGVMESVQPAYSNMAPADSMMSTKTEPICFTARQAHSGLSFSGQTGGNSGGGDYQDCGASSLRLMGEPPWFPPSTDGSSPATNRIHAVMRYKEKKKTRRFEKTVRYIARKARADVRRRVKGRFVKAGDAYDYDPLSSTRSC